MGLGWPCHHHSLRPGAQVPRCAVQTGCPMARVAPRMGVLQLAGGQQASSQQRPAAAAACSPEVRVPRFGGACHRFRTDGMVCYFKCMAAPSTLLIWRRPSTCLRESGGAARLLLMRRCNMGRWRHCSWCCALDGAEICKDMLNQCHLCCAQRRHALFDCQHPWVLGVAHAC